MSPAKSCERKCDFVSPVGRSVFYNPGFVEAIKIGKSILVHF